VTELAVAIISNDHHDLGEDNANAKEKKPAYWVPLQTFIFMGSDLVP